MPLASYREWLALSVALLGLWLMVWSLWGFAQRYQIAAGSDPDAGVLAADGEQGEALTYDVKDIVAAHLFGTAEREQPTAVEAPKTMLKLSLIGVLATDNRAYARALIQVQSKKTRAYAVGDMIEGTDAALHKVENQRVILDRQGKYESLVMTRKTLPPGAQSLGTTRQEQGAGDSQLSPTSPSVLPF